MSRIGKKQLPIPSGTTITVEGSFVTVSGPKGKVAREFPNVFLVEAKDNIASVQLVRKDEKLFPLWGTYASHLENMLLGVNTPYSKKLIIEGVGYRAEAGGKTLTLSLGFSHPVKIAIPEGVMVTVEKELLTISGIDKEMIGQFAASVRALKKPEPYKGKGIHYSDEVIRRKQGKKAAAAA